MTKIEQIITDLRNERYRWKPVRRIYVTKKNGSTKMRPLGLPSWSDKLLQEVIRSILEAYYEPQFSDHSHGFRPKRGCHTALSEITEVWTGTKWFIEGDIQACYDSVDHQILLSILADKIHDNRFLELLKRLLQAGYIENWHYERTYSGTPQGSIVSPILMNIYLDKLDKYVEQTVLPAYNRGKTRTINKDYQQLLHKASWQKHLGHQKQAKNLYQQAQQLPSGDPNDPDYRRLRYVRYADDILFGLAGPKVEAEEVKRLLSEFLRDSLKLELSQEKTLITHATNEAAHFLGYEIVNQQANDKQTGKIRRANGRIGLRVPAEVIKKKCAWYKRGGKPASRPLLIHDSDFSIIAQYQAQYRGIVQYYLLAQNVSWLQKLRFVMETSLLKTLAHKFKSSVRKMKRKYGTTVDSEYGLLKCLEVQVKRPDKKPLVARFGGIPLRHQKNATLSDNNYIIYRKSPTELLKRLLAEKCELCGSTESIQVHHIRKLADLKTKGQVDKPIWVERMAQRQRKTLVVCRKCHSDIHAGRVKQRRT